MVGRPRTSRRSFITASSIKLNCGSEHVAWSPRSSGTQASCFSRVGFILTNFNKYSKNVVNFYNGRGTGEQGIPEGKNAVQWTKLSCRTFKDNQTQLQRFALADNLANFLRRLALPRNVEHRSRTTLREKLVNLGVKVTRHAKNVTFQLAEVAVPRRLSAAILDRITWLAIPPPCVAGSHGSTDWSAKNSVSRDICAPTTTCTLPDVVQRGLRAGTRPENAEKSSRASHGGADTVVTIDGVQAWSGSRPIQSIWEMSIYLNFVPSWPDFVPEFVVPKARSYGSLGWSDDPL